MLKEPAFYIITNDPINEKAIEESFCVVKNGSANYVCQVVDGKEFYWAVLIHKTLLKSDKHVMLMRHIDSTENETIMKELLEEAFPEIHAIPYSIHSTY